MNAYLLAASIRAFTPSQIPSQTDPDKFEIFCLREQLTARECSLVRKGQEWRAAYLMCSEERTSLRQQVDLFFPRTSTAAETTPYNTGEIEAPITVESSFFTGWALGLSVAAGALGGLAIGYAVWGG